MGRIVKDERCPACAETGHDKTSNHLLVFEDGGKYCGRAEYHANGKPYVVKPEGSTTEEDDDSNMHWLKYTVQDALKLPVGSDPSRKVSTETANHFRTRVEFNTTNGELEKVFYPYIRDGKAVGYKIRKKYEEGDRELEKKPELLGKFKCFRAIGDVTGLLYNQHNIQGGGKRLLITEGEEDAHAAYEMLAKYNPKVCSIPSGATINKDGKGVLDKGILENLDLLRAFEEVYVCFDNDAAGKAITIELANVLGPVVKVVKLSEKDASDMLKKGKQQEFVNAFFSAKLYAPEGFVTIDDIWDEATAMPTWGKSWPWPTLTKLTYGRRLGEGIYFGAGVKVGKSESVNQIAHHVIENEEGKIALFKLEEKPSMTARKVAGKIMHKQFHVPDGPFTQDELKEGVDKVRNGVLLYDSYGATGWDKLKAAIRHAVVAEGCQDIVIDPLTRLTVGMNAADQNTELERISDEISKMAKDLGFFYMIFCHLKAPQTGKPHEEGGKVHSNQFHGSRAMMRACYYMVGIERDKTAEDETERNTSQFVLLEDRAFGNSGRFDVFYDRETGDYLEPERSF